MIKTKKISSTILFSILSIFLVIGSIFTFNTIKKKDSVVFADTISTNFTGSSIYFPCTPNYFSNSSEWNPISYNKPFNGAYVIYSPLNDEQPYYIFQNSIFHWVDGEWVDWSFNGFNSSSITALRIFTIGNCWYYSSGSDQYYIDFSDEQYDNTWRPMTWNGFIPPNGGYVWSDGVNYYYSYNSDQYILNINTFTWSPITWNFSNLNGFYTYNFNNNIYYLDRGNFYILQNNQWHILYAFNLSNVTYLNGASLWSYRNDLFFSFDNYQYIFNFSTNSFVSYSFNSVVTNGNSVWFLNDGFPRFNGGTTNGYIRSGYISSQLGYVAFDNLYFTFEEYYNSFALYQHSFITFIYNDTNQYILSDGFYISNSIDDFYDNNLTSTQYLLINNSSFDTSSQYWIGFTFNNVRYYLNLSIECDGLSNCNFSRVDFGGNTDLVDNKYHCSNYVKYTNSVGESIKISLFMVNVSSSYNVYYNGDVSPISAVLDDSVINRYDNFYFVFNDRTYYLNNADYDSSQYQQGYSVGYNSGQNAGYNSGYSAGVEAVSQSQYNSGYSAGYSQGVANSNNYSFLGLISAVIDAPIKAFTGLFNFNLLGVNIMQFITALFTLAVIITIIKKVV